VDVNGQTRRYQIELVLLNQLRDLHLDMVLLRTRPPAGFAALSTRLPALHRLAHLGPVKLPGAEIAVFAEDATHRARVPI
jgi:hypothetical protein